MCAESDDGLFLRLLIWIIVTHWLSVSVPPSTHPPPIFGWKTNILLIWPIIIQWLMVLFKTGHFCPRPQQHMYSFCSKYVVGWFQINLKKMIEIVLVALWHGRSNPVPPHGLVPPCERELRDKVGTAVQQLSSQHINSTTDTDCLHICLQKCLHICLQKCLHICLQNFLQICLHICQCYCIF